MCDPLSVASAAVTAYGTFRQYQSQQEAQSKINSAIENNDRKNMALELDTQNKALGATDKFDRENFDANQAGETQKLQGKFRDNLSQGNLPGEYYGGELSDNTKRYQEVQSKKASDTNNRMADALARLRGFEQGMRINNQAVSGAGEVAGMNRNFMIGNNNVLPYQIEAAKRGAQDPFADILVGAGSAGLTAGLSGAGPQSWGELFTKTPAGGIKNPNISKTFYLTR